MSRPNLVFRVALMTLALVAAAAPLWGQAEGRGNNEQFASRCRAAAEALRSGGTASVLKAARGQITSCPAEGPVYLAAQWERVGPDTASVDWLRFYSSRVRDARPLAVLRRTVLDRSRPDVVRVGAMLVLSKYVDPHSAHWYSDVRPPADSIRRIPLITSSTTGGGQLTGSQPVSGPIVPGVLQTLERVVANRAQESRATWYAASVLAKWVRASMEGGVAR